MIKKSFDIERSNQFIAHYRHKDGAVQDVWSHLLNVGKRAAENAAKIRLQNPASLCGLVHDLGKASQAFNNYIRTAEGLPVTSENPQKATKGKVDHSTAGGQWLYRQLKRNPGMILSPHILPLITVSHHSELIDCLTPDGENSFLRRMEKDDQMTHYEEVISNIPDWFKEIIQTKMSEPDLEKSLLAFVQQLNEPKDGVSEKYFKLGLLTRMLFSTLLDADRVDTIDFQNPFVESRRPDGKYLPWPTLMERFEKRLRHFSITNEIDSCRQRISQRCLEMATQKPGIFRLTVPTGGGKTLASLRFALHHAHRHQMDRIIYIVPYTAIIDQNAQTIRDFLETDADELAVVMEHHSNMDPEREVEENDHVWTQNWDAPVVLTTMVQFLEALYGSGTGPVRRMHQMANSVLIFDEIQSLPIRCVHIYNLAIRFLVMGCNSSAILCTATQPLLEKVKPASRSLSSTTIAEITPDVNSIFKKFKRVDVKCIADLCMISHEELAVKVIDAAYQSSSVLVILNTKKDAALLFEQVKSGCQLPVYHLSTHMCPSHRRVVLKEVTRHLNDKMPVICISTQLIEAGVDIDFNTAFRALAGLDSIQQAAGRCNRHGKLHRGELYLFQLINENTSKMKDIYVGKEVAIRIIDEYNKNPGDYDNDLLSAKVMDQYYEYYFYHRQCEMSYPFTRTEGIGIEGSLFDLLADNPQAVSAYERRSGQKPDILLKQSFQTAANVFHAIDRKTQGVLVPYGEEGEQIIQSLCSLNSWENPGKLMKRAQQYAVNCYTHELRRLQQAGALFETTRGSGIFYLDQRHYSLETGLQIQDTLQGMDTMMV